MDFTTTEAATDLGGLARSIVDAVCTPERQRALDGQDERFDREDDRTAAPAAPATGHADTDYERGRRDEARDERREERS